MSYTKLLLNGEETFARGTVVYDAYNAEGKPVPSSNHPVLENRNSGENTRVVSRGNVYVLNYNPSTYKALKPETFEEYVDMREQGLPLWKEVKTQHFSNL